MSGGLIMKGIKIKKITITSSPQNSHGFSVVCRVYPASEFHLLFVVGVFGMPRILPNNFVFGSTTPHYLVLGVEMEF